MSLAVTIAAAASWSALDVARKRLATRIPPVPLTLLFMLGQIPLWIAWVLVDAGAFLTSTYLAPGLACLVVNLIAQLLFMGALRLAPLSETIPLLSLTPAFSVAVAAPLLGEVPTLASGLGTIAILIGALLLPLAPGDLARPSLVFRRYAGSPGSLMMLGVAACFGAIIVLDKAALTHASPSVHALVQAVAMSSWLFVVLAGRRELGLLSGVRAVSGTYAIAIVTLAAAIALQLWAIQIWLVALVEAVKRAIGLSASVIAGRLLFGEPITPLKVAAVFLMGLGVAAIAASRLGPV